jgi:hypothetical protein
MSDTAITAEHANTADTAQTASFAVSANPVMFARVRGEDGFVYPEYSKGITQANIEKIGASPTGNIYCLSGLPPIRGGSVTIDARDSQETTTAPEFGFGVPINLGPGKDIGNCPLDTEAYVWTGGWTGRASKQCLPRLLSHPLLSLFVRVGEVAGSRFL